MLSTFLSTTSVIVLLFIGPVNIAALSSSSSSTANKATAGANTSTSTGTNTSSKSSSSSSPSSLLSTASINKISQGGVAIEHNWLPPHLIKALRHDARSLFQSGQFQPDGLTNTAIRSRSDQGFTSNADRQTFRGGAGWSSEVGNTAARMEFAERMRKLRGELAVGLDRPSLEAEGDDGRPKHEMTYNWYEPGAKLGRHLDEHHEETKGVKGWMVPTRRSVTWLVYLNDEWMEEEGGTLRCFPRATDELSQSIQVGAHLGNLQVGWMNGRDPVFLDCFSRPSGGAALYCLRNNDNEVESQSQSGGKASQKISILSPQDFDVPSQPIDFTNFLAEEHRPSFEQISTSRLDPRFAHTANNNDDGTATKTITAPSVLEKNALDIVPAAGTLVVFDSVSLPHRVREVTGKRQRIAATGWFHEDSQFVIEL